MEFRDGIEVEVRSGLKAAWRVELKQVGSLNHMFSIVFHCISMDFVTRNVFRTRLAQLNPRTSRSTTQAWATPWR